MQISESVKKQILELLFNFFEKEYLTVFVFGSFVEIYEFIKNRAITAFADLANTIESKIINF